MRSCSAICRPASTHAANGASFTRARSLVRCSRTASTWCQARWWSATGSYSPTLYRELGRPSRASFRRCELRRVAVSNSPNQKCNILIGSHLLDLNPLVISASAVWVGFDQYERAVVIYEAAIRFAVGVLVELGARQRAILVDFPLVRFAIAVAVLFRSNQRATARRRVEGLRRIVMLPPIDLVLVAGRRDLNAIHFAVASGVCPRVGLSVLIAREADLQQRPIVPVVLPTIHLPIFVEIDARPERLRAVHICPGVDDAVLVAVVGELSQLPARLVVGRQRRLLDPVAVWIVAGRGKRRGH